MNKTLVLFIFTFLFASCSSHQARMETGDLPLARIKHAVKKALPRGSRLISENGRVYYSNYYTQAKGRLFDARSLNVRRYAKVSVLGDMRPYKIVVEVIVEERSKEKSQIKAYYEHIKYDKGMAKVIVRRINKILSKSRNDSNVIDDFRVF